MIWFHLNVTEIFQKCNLWKLFYKNFLNPSSQYKGFNFFFQMVKKNVFQMVAWFVGVPTMRDVSKLFIWSVLIKTNYVKCLSFGEETHIV